MCDVGLEGVIPGEALNAFRRLISKGDVGLACDFLMRHYRDEYWPRRTGPMPQLRRRRSDKVIELPKPKVINVPIDRAINARRSADDFINEPISIEDLATILHMGVGITGWTQAYGYKQYPLRSYPSAGALQPVEAYPVVNNVLGLERGLYRYDPFDHVLEILKPGDYASLMADLALGQDHVSRASAVIVLTVVYARTYWKYWKRALRYVLLDAGAAMENIYLAATGLGLGVRAIGAFYDGELCRFLEIDCMSEFPVILMLVGRGIYLP
ncbi:MAG: dehydrogenase [Vulcanisaeta sp. CIS_19]|jgi:SagB-type dehydrogenase domain|nr:MAG: dehydrogenase [Vulcanisaeta sp. CIS_19]